ncbi:hypothetical protein [Lutispora sp.]|uniref:hypothetical protein n=1 Tax=Lutispora sp. TaxID=2828727 RepID=UPI000EED1E64|nr:hypothetical protein [Lutispora sp.]MEA4962204.1 hypothetical protein [Lutispora sp.]HCJ56316.1 hypothetical protein [Clostridiaceae bacterium]
MKKVYVIFAVFLLLLGISACFRFSIVGVNRDGLEGDARKSQKIDDSWQVSKSVTDDLGALLFYDKHLNDFTYSIYLNRKGFSFGYFFRSGGGTSGISNGIRAFNYGSSMALISMNKVNVARIECVSETGLIQDAVYMVEPGEPFAIAIPVTDDSMTVKIYDQNGNEIPITEISSYD